ncbi:MAG: OmpA family protein [Alphaproteobacteria bacterium]|nr:OmpA family protein [Alphaproteobacteria bacterium]
MEYHDEERRTVEKAPIWLVTFGDVVALLLTFFVMLFATTNIPSENWEAVVGTMSDSLRFSRAGRTPNPDSENAIPVVELKAALPSEYLTAVLRDHLSQDDVLKDAIVRQQDSRVVISLFGDAVFGAGNADLNEAASEAIYRLGGVIANVGNQLEVLGHADPSVLEGADFKSNWMLSLDRAMAVAKELRASGYRRNIIVLGLGDSRYTHLNVELSEARRLELARRVDLVLHDTAEER